MPSIQPRIGEDYTLYLGPKQFTDNGIQLQAIYLGYNPLKTHHWFKITRPEGHTFVATNVETKSLEFYCTRTQDLKETWLSEEDGPSWPVGIAAEKVDYIPKPRERGRIMELLANELLTKLEAKV